MAPTPKGKTGGAKGSKGTAGARKPSTKGSTTSSAFKAKKAGSTKSSAQPKHAQGPKKPTLLAKKKPPHLRYTEKELKVPLLNGILPAGIAKPPNAKKGKKFVDDKDSMNAILALVMAEKEGNIESKMMRARHLEELRDARRLEAEKRSQSKKESFEGRKEDIKQDSKDVKEDRRKRRPTEGGTVANLVSGDQAAARKPVKPKKRVSFG
ncbi:hypothetical protein LTR08_001039 [Meristemomyces frigidus]|nr:hypothetical protein LTR08_001039 [Meristemomyces frigidus]